MSPKHRSTQDDEALNGLPPIGPELRARREQHGIELLYAASTLRIKASYLAALEEGRYSDLPGAAYAIGFVRTYGDYLGFDGAEVVRRFKHEAAGGLSRRTTLTFPSPAPRGRVPGTTPLLIALIVAAGLAGAWYLWRDEARSLFGQVPDVPERLMAALNPAPAPQSGAPETAPAPVSTPPANTAGTAIVAPPPPASPPPAAAPVAPPPQAAAPVPAPTPAPTNAPTVGQTITLPPPAAATPPHATAPTPPAPPPVVAAVQPPPTPPQPVEPARRLAPIPVPPPAAAPADRSGGEDEVPPAPSGPEDTANAPATSAEPAAPPPPAPPVDGRVFGAVNDPVRIVIKSKGDSWVQVRDADNQPVMTRVLRSGDTYRVPNRQGLVLMTGNAGALEVSVDGQTAPALGPIGMVRRAVPLDADRLKTGTLPAE
ncbi:RodZ domain-containing protein [Lacibacterium aquatile]|uniref:RodZ domain-containing protein n=1 Tax=Lacibacterium aquatile TaxID=1168082 RepID=A0ABW5E133_9PROT